MTKLPKTRQASYEQGWEDGYAAADRTIREDLSPHFQTMYDELKNGWIPHEVLAAMKHVQRSLSDE